jgi:hypothetical protein
VVSVAIDLVSASSASVTAAFGLAGSLIGGAIAGTVSWAVARQAREAAERSWIRDTRRDVFDRFLTKAQDLHAGCEIYDRGGRDEASREVVERAFRDFFHIYAVLQTIAESRVVDAARIHGYRLHELRDEVLGKPGVLKAPDVALVSELVRDARHDTVDAMRKDLGLSAIAHPEDDFNAFAGTDLGKRYVPKRDRDAAHPRLDTGGSSGVP